ncbi:MAG: helix-turn-helix domain-containing protein [Alkalinema sp. RU_4_3]|nr:helix-turn-helix domain-containing protein [Alkalinema sp. RU_4_3]
MEHQEITKLVGISANTLRSYLREYKEGGIEGLKELHFYRPSSELMPHAESIESHFRKFPPISTNAAITAIEELTGIRRSPTQVRIFMKRLGMKQSTWPIYSTISGVPDSAKNVPKTCDLGTQADTKSSAAPPEAA